MTDDPVPVATEVTLAPGSFNAVAVSSSAPGLLAYRANAGELQVLWVDRAGRQIETVGGPDAAQLQLYRLSPDDSTLSVRRTVAGNTDVWFIDLERGVPRRFTFEAVRDVGAIWSPDGRRIVFQSEGTGVYDLYEKLFDGTESERLVLASSEPKLALDWSPDGRFILYAVQNPKGDNDLWFLPLAGDRKPLAITQTPFDENGGRFSPDGRWIAYQSDESGENEIDAQAFPGPGGKFQVSTAGGTGPQWRRDGRELFYRDRTNRLIGVQITISGTTLKVGTPVTLFTTPTVDFVASPDGQRFLVSTVTANPPITLLLNWAGQKKASP